MVLGCILALLIPAMLLTDADSAIEAGLQAYRKKEYSAAESAFREAIRLQPSSARGHKLLGVTLAAQKKFQLAEEPLKRACTLDPRERGACCYLGQLYYTLNRYEDSRKALETALRYDLLDRGPVLLALALTLEAVGATEAAERDYKAAIEAGHQRALIDYGMFLFRHGRGPESIAYLKKANATEVLERVMRALEGAPAAAQARTAPRPVLFEARPLEMVVKNGAFGNKYQIETMLGGIAVFDYDNDGWPDIYVCNGASIPSLEKKDSGFHNRLFHNDHDGTFSDVTYRAGVAGVGYSMGVAAADYDNDGWVDLFVTGVRTNTLFHNRGDGTFEDVTQLSGLASDGRWSIAAGWFDYDNDGLLDLFLVRYCVWNPETELYCGLQKPRYRAYCDPKYYAPLPNALYHNEGGGRFRDVSQESGIGAHFGKGMGVAFGDYDRDGGQDIFVANDAAPHFLFHNEGNGKFAETALAAGVAYNGDGTSSSSMGVDFRDYDNDGREDIFITDLTNERFMLFRNLGRGQFADMSGPSRIAALSFPYSGWSTGIFDFNNDGFKDVFVAGGHVMDNAEVIAGRTSRQPNLVLLNRGDGTFDLQLLPGEALHRGAAFGDFDRDGRMDVVVTRLNESPLVLRNVTPSSGHWIVLRLEGTQSNRDGIGARVHVVSPSGEQWNSVTTSVGYAGSSDRTVHFGLGKDTHVERIEVEWPSGFRQVLRDVPCDRYLTIQEARN